MGEEKSSSRQMLCWILSIQFWLFPQIFVVGNNKLVSDVYSRTGNLVLFLKKNSSQLMWPVQVHLQLIFTASGTLGIIKNYPLAYLCWENTIAVVSDMSISIRLVVGGNCSSHHCGFNVHINIADVLVCCCVWFVSEVHGTLIYGTYFFSPHFRCIQNSFMLWVHRWCTNNLP